MGSSMVPHLGRVLAFLIAYVAWRVSRLRPQHRAMAFWLCVAAIADLTRFGLSFAMDAPTPFHGIHRVIFHVDQGLMILEPLGLSVVAVYSLARARVDHLIGASCALWVVMIAAYPKLRGVPLGWCYFGIDAAVVVACTIATIVWTKEKRWPSMTEILIFAFAAARASLLIAGPYMAGGGPFANWWIGYGAQFACGITTLAVQASWLRSIR